MHWQSHLRPGNHIDAPAITSCPVPDLASWMYMHQQSQLCLALGVAKLCTRRVPDKCDCRCIIPTTICFGGLPYSSLNFFWLFFFVPNPIGGLGWAFIFYRTWERGDGGGGQVGHGSNEVMTMTLNWQLRFQCQLWNHPSRKHNKYFSIIA